MMNYQGNVKCLQLYMLDRYTLTQSTNMYKPLLFFLSFHLQLMQQPSRRLSSFIICYIFFSFFSLCIEYSLCFHFNSSNCIILAMLSQLQMFLCHELFTRFRFCITSACSVYIYYRDPFECMKKEKNMEKQSGKMPINGLRTHCTHTHWRRTC